MKTLITLLLLSNLCYAQNGSLAASADLLNSIRLIKLGNEFGTSFIVNYDDNQYLVTARHLFKNKYSNGVNVSVELSDLDKLVKLTFPVYFHSDTTIDIAVIKLPSNTLKNNFLKMNDEGNNTFIGQDCFFIGYPLGLGTLMEKSYLGLYKRAVFSGILDQPRGEMAFDAHNNQGFSGAPVLSSNGADYRNQYLMGVVSGYKVEETTLEAMKDKKKTTTNFISNSGVMIVYTAKKIIDIIKLNNL